MKNIFDAKEINKNINDDKTVLQTYMSLLNIEKNGFYIDIGASFIHNLSNSAIEKSDFTVFCECDPTKHVHLVKQRGNIGVITKKITPENIIGLLTKEINESFIDRDPDLVDIDIDGYDYYVLEALLKEYKPTLIVAEINEKIPPPIKFTVKYHQDYWWDVSHFYGMSISKASELFEKNGYEIINLTFNNVYAIKKQENKNFPVYTAEEAYDTFYKKAGWEEHFLV
jgi:hypothetical protein